MEKLKNGKYKINNEIINEYEFTRRRIIRDCIRFSIIAGVAGISMLINLISVEKYLSAEIYLTTGIIFLMLGWRLKTGW
jgi:hypothetical protein